MVVNSLQGPEYGPRPNRSGGHAVEPTKIDITRFELGLDSGGAPKSESCDGVLKELQFGLAALKQSNFRGLQGYRQRDTWKSIAGADVEKASACPPGLDQSEHLH